jgi:hypothetical protein
VTSTTVAKPATAVPPRRSVGRTIMTSAVAVGSLAVLVAFAVARLSSPADSSAQASPLPPGTPVAPPSTVHIGTISVTMVNYPSGPRRMVQLDGWPQGVFTVSVCGNEARRATQDCEVSGSQGAAVGVSGSALVAFPTAPPPIGCPCVLRVSASDSSVVGMARVDLPGVPMLTPDQMPAAPPKAVSASDLVVTAVVDPATMSPTEALAASFGGPAKRSLHLTLHNSGTAVMGSLSITAGIGADSSSGEPLTMPPIAPLAPGATQDLFVPVTISAPAVGSSVVHGRVYGLDGSSTFAARTENTPWGLVVIAALALVLALVRLIGGRSRRRRPALAVARVEPASAPVAELTATAAVGHDQPAVALDATGEAGADEDEPADPNGEREPDLPPTPAATA